MRGHQQSRHLGWAEKEGHTRDGARARVAGGNQEAVGPAGQSGELSDMTEREPDTAAETFPGGGRAQRCMNLYESPLSFLPEQFQ